MPAEEVPPGLLSPLPGHERVRLKRNHPRYTYRTGFSLTGAILFGGVFVLVGLGIIGLAADWFPIREVSKQAPDSVIAVIGVVFAGCGAMVIGMGFREWKRIGRMKAFRSRYPNEPAMQDHVWDREGHTPPRWQSAFTVLGGAIFMTVFMSAFNWVAWFTANAPIVIQIVTVLFDLLLVFLWFQAIRALIRAVRFGDCRVHYPRFPLRPGEEIDLRFTLPAGVEQVRAAILRLRCLQEYVVKSRRGHNRSSVLRQDQLYLEERRITAGEIGSAPRELRATFLLPEASPATQLDEKMPVAWEVELELDVPGVNAVYPFLLPVYPEARTSGQS